MFKSDQNIAHKFVVNYSRAKLIRRGKTITFEKKNQKSVTTEN